MTGSGVSLRAFRDLPTLLHCLECKAVAFGVFRFLRGIFRSKRVDFELNLDTMKPYCIVVNELSTLNTFLRPALLALITDLLCSAVEGMEDLSQVSSPFADTLRVVVVFTVGGTRFFIPISQCVQNLP